MRRGVARTELNANVFALSYLRQMRRLMKFGNSAVHGSGLFIAEIVPVGKFVIDYVEDVIRMTSLHACMT